MSTFCWRATKHLGIDTSYTSYIIWYCHQYIYYMFINGRYFVSRLEGSKSPGGKQNIQREIIADFSPLTTKDYTRGKYKGF